MRFRLDDHECRFLLQRGPAEDVTTLGWQLDDHETFDTVLARIRQHGVPAVEGTDDAGGAARRRAAGPIPRTQRPHPGGLHPREARREPLQMAARGGFVTGAAGMGHVAVTTTRPHQVRGYYNTVFDARLSDFIDETISGLKFKIRFLRVNERHHSVAIAAVNRMPLNPIRTRVQHLNIQVADLDDMTAAYQRVKELGFRMALGVGQHTNDKELSFYAVTPSGFEWEVGWNPIVVDETTWEPTTYQGISIWGHTREGQTIVDKFAQFKTGASSLLTRRGRRSRACRRGNSRPLMPTILEQRCCESTPITTPSPPTTETSCARQDWTRPVDARYPSGVRTGRCRRCPNSVSEPQSCRCPRLAPRSCRTRPTPPRWLATSTTTWPAVVTAQPDRFGFFATVPMPHVDESVAEVVRSLGRSARRRRCPAGERSWRLPGAGSSKMTCSPPSMRVRRSYSSTPPSYPAPPSTVSRPFATDFLLDTTRAAYLLVRNGFAASTPISGSSSATPVDSCPTPRTGWRSAS